MEKLPLEARAESLVNLRQSTVSRARRLLLVGLSYRWSQISRRALKLMRQRLSPRAVVGVRESAGEVNFAASGQSVIDAAELAVRACAGHVSHSRCDLQRGQIVLLCEPRELGWPIDWTGWEALVATQVATARVSGVGNRKAEVDHSFSNHPPLAVARSSRRERGFTSLDTNGSKVAERPSHLWRFHLHYHEWLMAFAADEEVAGREPTGLVWEVVDQWIKSHPADSVLRSDDAWHPYCISRRLAVWSWLIWSCPHSQLVGPEVRRSYWQQADYLSRNLELDLGGNHLLENLAALAIAASTLECEEASQWEELVIRHLARELPRQVLAHGEHFERSPIYHCQVLGNLLRIMAVSSNSRLVEICKDYVARMLSFLQTITMADGEVPLFGDSVFSESPSVSQIDALASLLRITIPETPRGSADECGGYVRLLDATGRTSVTVDAGDVGAPELPAHAHCDLLNVEVAIGTNRWISDTGNYDYEAGSMRAFCRSSMAHTVATIDCQNHSDIWSKFRMVDQGQVLSLRSGMNDRLSWCHAAYRVRYSRKWVNLQRIVVVTSDGDLVVADRVETQSEFPIVGFVQIDPGIDSEPVNNVPYCWQLTDGAVMKRLIVKGAADADSHDGWRCPNFGVRQRRGVIEYRAAGAFCGWMLLEPSASTNVEITRHGVSFFGGETKVTFDG